MNQPKPKIVDPSIDEMLTSIRDAIHEETAREAEEHARTFKTKPKPAPLKPEARRPSAPVPPAATPSRASSVSGSMRELRVSLQPAGQAHTRGTVTARSQDFLSLKNKLASLRQNQPAPSGGGDMAKIMGGDPRLEDAIDRMATAEQLQRQNAPVPPRAETQVPPQSHEEMPMRGAALDDVPGEQPEITYSPNEETYQDDPENDDAGFEEFATEPDVLEVAAEPSDVAAETPQVVESSDRVQVHRVADQAPPEPVQHTPIHPEPIEPVVFHDAPAQPAQVEAAPVEPTPVEPEVVHPTPIQPAAIEPAVVITPRLEARLPVQPEPVSMMAGEAMRVAGSAFERLSDELFSRTSGGAQVLEDSAQDMIKPMLKNWLDDNLPGLVERLVREEIERVVRKGGR